MGAQLGLPAALRARGLTVETVPGWETRSAGSFDPRGAVCHWTAGPRNTRTRPSLRVVVDGRPDLPGPLCNVYLDRAGIAVVVAANRANHAGAGSWRGLTGNSAVFGTEAEAADNADFTPAQRAAYPRINAAYCDLGGFAADMVCGHSEWAGPRKTDIDGYTMDDMRRAVAAVLAAAPQEDDMTPEQAAQLTRVHTELTTRFPSRATPDATYTDTVAGYVLNADGATWRIEQQVTALAARVDRLTAAPPVAVDAAAVAAALAGNRGFLSALAAAVNSDAARRLAT